MNKSTFTISIILFLSLITHCFSQAEVKVIIPNVTGELYDAVAISGNNTYIATVSFEVDNNVFSVWDFKSGKLVYSNETLSLFDSFLFFENDHTVKIGNIENREVYSYDILKDIFVEDNSFLNISEMERYDAKYYSFLGSTNDKMSWPINSNLTLFLTKTEDVFSKVFAEIKDSQNKVLFSDTTFGYFCISNNGKMISVNQNLFDISSVFRQLNFKNINDRVLNFSTKEKEKEKEKLELKLDEDLSLIFSKSFAYTEIADTLFLVNKNNQKYGIDGLFVNAPIMCMTQDKKYLFCNGIIYDLNTLTMHQSLKTMQQSVDGYSHSLSRIEDYNTDKISNRKDYNSIDFNYYTKRYNHENISFGQGLDKIGNDYVFQSKNEKIYNLKKKSYTNDSLTSSSFPFDHKELRVRRISENGKRILCEMDYPNIDEPAMIIYDFETNEVIFKIGYGDGEGGSASPFNNIEFLDNNIILVYDYDLFEFYTYNLSTKNKEIISDSNIGISKKRSKKETSNLTCFTVLNDSLILFNDDDLFENPAIVIYDYKEKNLVSRFTFDTQTILDYESNSHIVVLNKDSSQFAYYFDPVFMDDLKTNKHHIYVIDIKSAKIVKDIVTNNLLVESIKFSEDSKHLIVSNNVGETQLFDLESSQKEVTFFELNKSEHLILTPEKYYLFTGKSNDLIHFSKSGEIFEFEQFDLKYNRPDIILTKLGSSDKSLIEAYNAAYLKRLKKMNFTEDMLEDDFHIPEIKIENFEEIPILDEQGSIDLKLNIEDTKYNLDRINLWINDVAIYGSNGISLRDKNIKTYSTTLSVNLAKGKNKVQVSVLNQAGAESYKETFEIESKVGKSKPDLYLITIGESKFKQADFNLTYAAKDAKDMATLFASSKAYGEVKTKTITNEQVSKESILALKTFLKDADINDQVMIFIAGHGVLDADLDYYFATHEMDFANPSEKGLAYEDLESLLDGIKPLKKTLIIDACHSGEIDKDEMELAVATSEEVKDVQFRSVGTTAQPKLGMQNTFELTKSLFTDLRKGTGATVISSAGGMEFAMESGEWKNGLFTYALINGVKSGKADLNKDGEIWLSEIQEYVGKEVSVLSGGRQQPTSRIENQSVDFRVW